MIVYSHVVADALIECAGMRPGVAVGERKNPKVGVGPRGDLDHNKDASMIRPQCFNGQYRVRNGPIPLSSSGADDE